MKYGLWRMCAPRNGVTISLVNSQYLVNMDFWQCVPREPGHVTIPSVRTESHYGADCSEFLKHNKKSHENKIKLTSQNFYLSERSRPNHISVTNANVRF